jgi:hypothetical protein
VASHSGVFNLNRQSNRTVTIINVTLMLLAMHNLCLFLKRQFYWLQTDFLSIMVELLGVIG